MGELTPFQLQTLEKLAHGEVEDDGEAIHIASDVLPEVKQLLLRLNEQYSWGRKVFIDGGHDGLAALRLDPFGHIFWTPTDVAVQPHSCVGFELVTFPRGDVSRMVASVAHYLAQLAADFRLTFTCGARYHVALPLKPHSRVRPTGVTFCAVEAFRTQARAELRPTDDARLIIRPKDGSAPIVLAHDADRIEYDSQTFTAVSRPNQTDELRSTFEPWLVNMELQ